MSEQIKIPTEMLQKYWGSGTGADSSAAFSAGGIHSAFKRWVGLLSEGCFATFSSCWSSQAPTSSRICSLGLSPRVLLFSSVRSQSFIFSFVSKLFRRHWCSHERWFTWEKPSLYSLFAVFAKFLTSVEPGRWKLVTEWQFVTTPGSAVCSLG